MKKSGFSLVEIMVILGALGGVALLVTKLGNNSMSIKNESVVTNDYNDLVREAHFLIANQKACKVSLAGLEFTPSEKIFSLPNIELWASDSRGEKRVTKKFAKGEKFAGLQIEDVTLTLDPVLEESAGVVAASASANNDSNEIKNTTGFLKISIIKPKTKNSIVDIEHSINVNYSINKTSGAATIIDCGDKREALENTVWCGPIQNPCGTEVFAAVAVGRYKNGKFTGVLQPTGLVEGKICKGAVNHPANLTACAAP